MNHVRHLGIYSIPSYFNVGVVGAGGLGAITALVLTKMGVQQLTVWDDDVVSEENIPVQLHPVAGIGQRKIDTLKETLETFSDEIVFFGNDIRIDLGTKLFDHYHLFIAAVDSINARKDIWAVVTSSAVDWFYDMRMGSEEFHGFLVDMHDPEAVERYDAMLMGIQEQDIPEVPCTMKSTFHCASAAAAHAGVVLRNLVKGKAQSHRLVHYLADETVLKFRL